MSPVSDSPAHRSALPTSRLASQTGFFSGGSRLSHVWVNHLLITALLAPLQVAVLRAVERKPSEVGGE